MVLSFMYSTLGYVFPFVAMLLYSPHSEQPQSSFSHFLSENRHVDPNEHLLVLFLISLKSAKGT